ncbi:hypothetical protein P3T76_002499 [Phytophthora citrophthora]|uniref:Uncharacterized protein n=1 Tax=Phytophthora citrophthora TaxID=4793 RepID=A0AAD9GWP1_9STRA|nr:hypothetical protein P3T76_002499 [Phytophthora citrophthora]
MKKTLVEKYGDNLVQILSGDLSGGLKVFLIAMRGEVADFAAFVHTSWWRLHGNEPANIVLLNPTRSFNSSYVTKTEELRHGREVRHIGKVMPLE